MTGCQRCRAVARNQLTHPWAESGKEALDTSLLGKRNQARGLRAAGAVALVDLREQSVGRLGLGWAGAGHVRDSRWQLRNRR